MAPDTSRHEGHIARVRMPRTAVAVIALVASLLLAELALRAFHPISYRAPVPHVWGDDWRLLVHRPSPTPGLPYELNPGARGNYMQMECSINALGMRGPEVDVHKPEQTSRIVAIGDSVTFGWNVSAEFAWPAQLQRALSERVGAQPVQVLNCGVSGYNTRDEALAIERRAAELDPDVVVLGYFLNDPEVIPMAPLQRYFEKPAWWQHSQLLRLVAGATYQHELRRFGGGDYYRYLHAPDGPCWPQELAAFDHVRDVTRARVPHTLIVLFPAYPRNVAWSDYPWRDLHAQVAAAWKERGLDVLDLLPAFARSGLPPSQLSVDTEHPNPRGHALAASAIATEIERLAWLAAR